MKIKYFISRLVIKFIAVFALLFKENFEDETFKDRFLIKSLINI